MRCWECDVSTVIVVGCVSKLSVRRGQSWDEFWADEVVTVAISDVLFAVECEMRKDQWRGWRVGSTRCTSEMFR